MNETYEPIDLFFLLSDPNDLRLHNCKFLQATAEFDEPMSLLAHYDSLSDELKNSHPLSFDLLKQMNQLMHADEVIHLLGLSHNAIKKAWHIKYVGRTVFFCEQAQLAVRVHFSNTSKKNVAVYANDKMSAWATQAGVWRFFGVVDVLYKGRGKILIDDYVIEKQENYQSLPANISLVVTNWLNEQKLDNDPNLSRLFEAITERVVLTLPNQDE